MTSSLLFVKNLSYILNDSILLQDVSFDLQEGSILAIAGPNGAGKTTLLNLLSGIRSITKGDVLIQGRSIKQMSAPERARTIAVVSQQEQPEGLLMLRDYVALGQVPIWTDRSIEEHRVDLDRILHLTGLSSLAEKRIEVLSGGERQRAHIARALAQNPFLLFLDEPTNHLDPDAKSRILSLIVDLGITVVMVIHDLVMIPVFATHVALMHSARMTAFGPVNRVLTAERVRETFGVDYLCFYRDGRMIPALDIRNTKISNLKRNR